MARAMAHNSSHSAGQAFNIFDDDGSLFSKDGRIALDPSSSPDSSNVLGELSKGQSQSRSISADKLLSSSPLACPFIKSPGRGSAGLDARPAKCPAIRLTSRTQRPQALAETFEPLGAVPEESNSAVDKGDTVPAPAASMADQSSATSMQTDAIQRMLMTTDSTPSLEEQIQKHLSGQFEWIMMYPAGNGSHAAGGSVEGSHHHHQENQPAFTVYGCNALPARMRLATHESPESPTDVYTLLATSLSKEPHECPSMADCVGIDGPGSRHLPQLPPPPYYPGTGTPPKLPEVTTLVEKKKVSPSLTVVSERSGGLIDASSQADSFPPLPRIEDSLEELDRLEEELEAVHQVTRTRQYVPAHDEPYQTSPCNFERKPPTSAAAKRVSIAGYSATVRVKPSQDKLQPSLRRSASLTLRDRNAAQKQQQQQQQGSSSMVDPKLEASVSHTRSAITRLNTPKHSVKSSKPPTVPRFELPGEAVARRLKEQREARLALQAEAQKAHLPPAPKQRASKLLARPTFELPGEAISRRKREEQEAKLRAEEEEARKRREFKARPVRQSIGPPTAPRETLTSRARRGQASLDADEGSESQLHKRLSVGAARNNTRVSPIASFQQTRGRNPGISSTEASRATSTSTGSSSGKRQSVSLEELTVQRQRGREILSKDSSYMQEKQREKKEREMAAKMAREQAAERSRIASREWAEKKRRKELEVKQPKENRRDP